MSSAQELITSTSFSDAVLLQCLVNEVHNLNIDAIKKCEPCHNEYLIGDIFQCLYQLKTFHTIF